MSNPNKRTAHNKIVFTDEQHEFIRKSVPTMTNREIADHLGVKLTRLRNEMYSLGLKRMEVEYITPEQLQVILDNWRTRGDSEIAQMLNDQYPKNKPWTKKHVEKKRRYLNLKRTEEEIHNIFLRNVAKGDFRLCPVKAWKTRGVTPPYTLKKWNQNGYERLYIKTSSGYKLYARWVWELHNGEIPKGFNLIHINGKSTDCELSNLKLITKAENAVQNKVKLTSLPKDLQRLVLIKNKLLKRIKKKENG